MISHDDDEHLIFFEGLDDAILGLAAQHCGPGPLVAYSMRKILAAYRSQGMSDEGALEYFCHNTHCLYAGPSTPLIVDDVATHWLEEIKARTCND